MNSCILMATIVRKPELRHTQDARAVTDTIVEFEGAKPEEKSTLLVVGWGNLAEEIFANYSVGDRIIIEGVFR
ncbi:MAG: single-stranded DNA-binding protein [Hydrococcus sp. RU_2_2]|nr:single-stranded DNA-binding protein [Hydrococcus sp. RU_2_2]